MPFFVVFMILPFLEIMTFIAVSDEIGFLWALALIMAAGFAGIALVRHQGLQTLLSMRAAADRGAMPLNELFDGVCIVLAGFLLLVPGFITDLVAFFLLVPHARRLARVFVRNHTSWSDNQSAAASYTAYESMKIRRDPGVLDGEYERLDDEPR